MAVDSQQPGHFAVCLIAHGEGHGQRSRARQHHGVTVIARVQQFVAAEALALPRGEQETDATRGEDSASFYDDRKFVFVCC